MTPDVKTGERKPLRSCVILSSATIGGHMVMVAGSGEPVMMSITQIVLIIACVRCSVTFWKSPNRSSGTSMLLIAILMLVAHSVLLGFGHAHGTSESPGGSETSGAFLSPASSGALVFCASLVEVVIVIQLATWLRRSRGTSTAALKS